jgi:hypothetical protein
MKTSNHKKQITKKLQNPITKKAGFGCLRFCVFEHCDLFGISDFGFGIFKSFSAVSAFSVAKN